MTDITTTASVTLFLDKHVTEFLAKFTNVTNSLACIIRSFEGLEYLRVLAAVMVVIGVQLVEPFLSLTTSSSTTWEDLVKAFPSLYNDLISTKPELMLDLTTPAFSFISKDRFNQCLYPPSLLEPTIIVIEQYRGDICSTLQLLLPMLAAGWKRQRGEMFEFGSNSDSNNQQSPMVIKNLDQEKLMKAPVHNLDSERAVGSVNYGLKVRGAKQIKSVSTALVKAKASELMEGKVVTKELKKMTKKGGAVPEIVKEWEKKQAELKQKGMDEKELNNVAQDKQRNADLATLTEQGGPFTKPEQVKEFLQKKLASKRPKKTRGSVLRSDMQKTLLSAILSAVISSALKGKARTSHLLSMVRTSLPTSVGSPVAWKCNSATSRRPSSRLPRYRL